MSAIAVVVVTPTLGDSTPATEVAITIGWTNRQTHFVDGHVCLLAFLPSTSSGGGFVAPWTNSDPKMFDVDPYLGATTVRGPFAGIELGPSSQ